MTSVIPANNYYKYEYYEYKYYYYKTVINLITSG